MNACIRSVALRVGGVRSCGAVCVRLHDKGYIRKLSVTLTNIHAEPTAVTRTRYAFINYPLLVIDANLKRNLETSNARVSFPSSLVS